MSTENDTITEERRLVAPDTLPTQAPIDPVDAWGEVKVVLSFKEIKVVVEDKDYVDPTTQKKGRRRRFLMRELTGKARDTYLTESTKKTEVGTDGYQRVVDFTGSCADLLSRMLFEVNNVDGVDKVAPMPMPVNEIQLWPSAVQLTLYKKALEISGLHERAEEESKNV